MSASFLHDDGDSSRASARAALRFLLRSAAPYRHFSGAGLLLLVLSAVGSSLAAWALGEVVTRLTTDGGDPYAAVVMLLALELAVIGLSYSGRRLFAEGASRTILSIRRALFEQSQRLPITYFERQPLGRTITRMTHDVEGLEEFFGNTMGTMVLSLLMSGSAAVALVLQHQAVGGVLVLAVLPALFWTWVNSREALEINRDLSRKNSAANARLSEYLSGIPVIRAFALEAWTHRGFTESVGAHQRIGFDFNAFNAAVRPLISLLCNLPLLTLVIVGGDAVLSGGMALGAFVASLRLCDRLGKPIDNISREIHLIQTAITSGERITALLNSETEEVALGADGDYRGAPRGAVEFRHVSMNYGGGRDALSDVSFNVSPGQRIGLVGATGSGKTSTVALLARLYDFQRGEILLDGIPIRSFRRSALRGALGFVSQEAILFRGTLRDNLSGENSVSDATILDACRETGLAEIMEKNRLSLDALVLDRGANLSMGERQLIALTRVLVCSPSMLVLDEATANIDPHFERIIHSAVDKVMRGRTCFLIAHRLATVQACDRILVFKRGSVVEQGTHEALLEANGYYASLVRGFGSEEPLGEQAPP